MNWDSPSAVSRFVGTPPNAVLTELAARLLRRQGPVDVLDIGCGAGRNAVPLALLGHRVTGVDNAPRMLEAARGQAVARGAQDCTWVAAEMDQLPFAEASFDLVVAHGVWNLAGSDGQFLRAVAEAGRVARPGATLFVFTFARLAAGGLAVPGPQAGESRFAVPSADGSARCYTSAADLDQVLEAVGFLRPTEAPLTLYNAVPRPGSAPPIYEGVWQKHA